MVVVGVDTHKRSYTVVAADQAGRWLGELTLGGETELEELLAWAPRFGEEQTWAVEDCRPYSSRLEELLLARGAKVVRVPPKLMGKSRRGSRAPGKSDGIDALAVARAALAEPDLPLARAHPAAQELKLLVDHREDLVGERRRHQCRLRGLLHQLRPGWDPRPGSLDRDKALAEIGRQLGEWEDRLVARLATEVVIMIGELNGRIRRLEREVKDRITPLAPTLLAVPGVGPLGAAKLYAETAGVERFKSKAAYALWSGTAPIPASSGGSARYRLNRGGNRQANAALHRIAVTQARCYQPAKDYLSDRIAKGNSKTEALRALRRHLSNRVYRELRADLHLTPLT